MFWGISLAVGWLIALCWIYGGSALLRFVRNRRLETLTQPLRDPELWPSVSVIVAARNESSHIEPSLRSLIQVDYPNLEIIAIDDRSTDGTGEIMDRLALRSPCLHIIHISNLPEGWLGKCHALHRGKQSSAGDLLLFTDGDVMFAPETLRLAVRYLTTKGLDHLVLLPGFPQRGYWENALKTFFAMAFILGMRVWAVSKTSRHVYAGVGAFNLVRRAAYDGVGGHASLRMDVIDDVMLGKRLKQHGYRQDVLIAAHLLELEWLEGVRGFIRGLEKNAFASLRYSIAFLILVTLVFAIFYAVPYLGIVIFHDFRIWGYIAATIAMHAIFGIHASNYRNGWRLTASLPAVALIYLWTFWRSAAVTLRQGGIQWRETFYSLKALKRASSSK